MAKKTRTSGEILREDYTWPMTVGQVADLTGVTRKMLRDYDKRGLLSAARTGEDVANNRKLYFPEDVDRLKQIRVLVTYGFGLDEVAVILDSGMSVADALGMRLEELRREEAHIRNMIMFARFAALVGDDIFETLAFGTSDIDGFAEVLCATERFQAYVARQRALTVEEQDAIWEAFCDLIEEFLLIYDDLSMTELERFVERLRLWFCEAYCPIAGLELLPLWTLFVDGADAAELAEELGGEGTAGFLQATVFFVWAKQTLFGLAALAGDGGEGLDADAAVDEVARYLCGRLGLVLDGDEPIPWDEEDRQELCVAILGYLEKLLEDPEALEIIDPAGKLPAGESGWLARMVALAG
ncbi:MerR family transcriptional regulator [uncultured Adlercreutzia sp.]|uniref:MerR family transcriptional regulator n=1 Tax=uncultured Adlercreutzia sp. TaxID=875803 RepID=UPI0025DB72A5|nr:MerR family transcriptional regulator [uncultured Adlercreutzia sp.]